MPGKDVLTTRIDNVVKVEINDPENSYGTMPNYGYITRFSDEVATLRRKFAWWLQSGESGESMTEQAAINAAARAIRSHARRNKDRPTEVEYTE